MRRIISTIIVALLVAWPALSDSPADSAAQKNGCVIFTLCDAEADTTAACDDGSDNIVARLAGNYTQTLYATQSTASSFTCHLFSSDNGYSATARQQITSTALSQAQYAITIEGPMDYEWIECSAIADNAVTITSLACPLR